MYILIPLLGRKLNYMYIRGFSNINYGLNISPNLHGVAYIWTSGNSTEEYVLLKLSFCEAILLNLKEREHELEWKIQSQRENT